jgi:hypothetical protein
MADRHLTFRPVPVDHCYRCGFAPCSATWADSVAEDDGTCNRDLAEPLHVESWLDLASGDALRAVFGTGRPARDPASQDLVRALGARIARWA